MLYRGCGGVIVGMAAGLLLLHDAAAAAAAAWILNSLFSSAVRSAAAAIAAAFGEESGMVDDFKLCSSQDLIRDTLRLSLSPERGSYGQIIW